MAKKAPLKINDKLRQVPWFFERVELTTKLEALYSPASPLRRGLSKRFLLDFDEINHKYYQIQHDEDHFNFHKELNLIKVNGRCDSVEDSEGANA